MGKPLIKFYKWQINQYSRFLMFYLLTVLKLVDRFFELLGHYMNRGQYRYYYFKRPG